MASIEWPEPPQGRLKEFWNCLLLKLRLKHPGPEDILTGRTIRALKEFAEEHGRQTRKEMSKIGEQVIRLHQEAELLLKEMEKINKEMKSRLNEDSKNREEDSIENKR